MLFLLLLLFYYCFIIIIIIIILLLLYYYYYIIILLLLLLLLLLFFFFLLLLLLLCYCYYIVLYLYLFLVFPKKVSRKILFKTAFSLLPSRGTKHPNEYNIDNSINNRSNLMQVLGKVHYIMPYNISVNKNILIILRDQTFS